MFRIIVDRDSCCANCNTASGYQQSSPSLIIILPTLPRGLGRYICCRIGFACKCPLRIDPARKRLSLRKRAPKWYRLLLRPYACSAYPCPAEERREGAQSRHHGRMLTARNRRVSNAQHSKAKLTSTERRTKGGNRPLWA